MVSSRRSEQHKWSLPRKGLRLSFHSQNTLKDSVTSQTLFDKQRNACELLTSFERSQLRAARLGIGAPLWRRWAGSPATCRTGRGRAGRRQRASVGKISAKCCSVSAVSAPIFARKYAFCSIFQNLPDSQAGRVSRKSKLINVRRGKVR